MQKSAQPLSRRLGAALPPAGAARILAVNGFVGSLGTGLFLTGSVLYYTRVVGLSDAQVGLGLSVAGICGMLGSVPIGRLADRWGPRQMMVVLHLWRVVGYAMLALVHGFWSFLVVVCLVTVAERGGPPCSQALVGTLFRRQERVRAMAYLRAVRNIGLSAGALLAGIALVADTPTGYRLLSLGNAASFLPMALLVASLRRYQKAATHDGSDAEEIPPPRELRPLRDLPFLALAASNGLLMLHDSVLFVALPLWIAQRTAAPHIMISLMLTINTVLTAVSQVQWTRLTGTLATALRAMVAAGLILAVASALIGAAHLGGPVTASVLLVLGVTALTVGENLHSASSWRVSFALSPERARARYLAVFGLGEAGQEMVGPSLTISLCWVPDCPVGSAWACCSPSSVRAAAPWRDGWRPGGGDRQAWSRLKRTRRPSPRQHRRPSCRNDAARGAAEGGEGMTQVPFFDGRASFAQRWDDIARQANRVFDFGKFSHAALTSELEEAVKDYTGARFAVGMNSGTDALLVILRAIGVGEGDEVIVPAVATPSSASSVCHAGARPVFVDVQPGAYTIAPDAVRSGLTDRSRAIMPVHLFTQMADMPALRTIAREAGVVLIEDSRQAIGMRHAGMHSGLLSTAGALSFSPRKTLGALGDAGMVITDDDNVADRCALLRHHGRTGEAADRASGVSSPAALVGINSKMDELQAAVLLARLPWLDAAIARRGELAACYTEHLAEMAEVTTPVIVPWDDPTEQVWHAYVIEAERRDALASHLARAGIETEVPCPVALHLQPCFRYLKGRRGDHPVAEAVAERMLGLPLYPDLSFRDVEYVCHTVEQFYRRSRA